MKTFKHGDKFSIHSPDVSGVFEVMTPSGVAAENRRVYGSAFPAYVPVEADVAFLCNHSSVIDDGKGQAWPKDIQSFADHVIIEGREYVIVKALNRRADLVPQSK